MPKRNLLLGKAQWLVGVVKMLIAVNYKSWTRLPPRLTSETNFSSQKPTDQTNSRTKQTFFWMHVKVIVLLK